MYIEPKHPLIYGFKHIMWKVDMKKLPKKGKRHSCLKSLKGKQTETDITVGFPAEIQPYLLVVKKLLNL